jgi:SAM-dependent methyltransferase
MPPGTLPSIQINGKITKMEEIYKNHTRCRVCNSTNLEKYLDLGLVPLANNLENTQQKAMYSEQFPLEIMLCKDCGLSQLSIVIDPEKLYSHYTYRSSINVGYIKHCRKMVTELKSKYSLDRNSFVIDIAGNDGTLLKEFIEEIRCDVLNIDPAENLVQICKNQGIPAWNVFWSYEISKALKGQADIITATNVFAHVDNVTDFLKAAKMALKPNGILVIECPYVVDHINKNEWTQTYFEHLSYMSVTPIHILCKSLDMRIINVEKQEIHGGTIRVIITHKDSSLETEDSVEYFLDGEYDDKYLDIKTYKKWSEKVYSSIDKFAENIIHLRDMGYKVAAFSASAKGNTLLNASYIGYEQIDYIIDETPEKIGMYSPGTGIQILGLDTLCLDPPDYLVILSWNFKDEIMEKCRKNGYIGKFIIPIPKFETVK